MVIYIRGLKVDAQIGIHAWEQCIRQTLSFDLELKLPGSPTDTQVPTVDYAQVAARVTDFVRSGVFVLLETLAEDVAALILREFKGISSLRLQLSKLAIIPNAREVGVIVERA